MARQLRAEQTRATIITAAADLFDRQGYDSTSLSDIVAHAKVTKGALYFHFAAKDDLAQAIQELNAEAARRLVTEVESRGYSSLEALMRATFGIARLAVEDPVPRAALRLATADIAVRPPAGHLFTEWLEFATRKFHGAVREADLHSELDVGVVAHSLVSFYVGTRVAGRSLEPVGRLPRRVAEMWHLMIRGLVPVHRRPRYVTLATQLEREIRTA
ncbi:ScbR family autoregulator-binding transcription factor [Streptomyces monashensis]|uniref:TetR family transcriptional regulator n=1 Tax=Streptomyces monashensis TaxID=1678012 RepID=A0A1S2QL66_9ACTN|nr:ScbR family autoregulator-binding transcription factor [Streptomyces monashensis]OIK06196.1 TetR family transcriptional regulator [Streptomyces monashensis]